MDTCISSINETVINNILIYPNPSVEIFNIEFNSIVSQDLQVRVVNSLGTLVFIEDLNNYIGQYKKQISLKKYSKAIYFLEIQTDDGAVVKKIIIE